MSFKRRAPAMRHDSFAGRSRGIIVGKMDEMSRKGTSPGLPSLFLLAEEANPRSQDDKDPA
jgi:hypothetical protein